MFKKSFHTFLVGFLFVMLSSIMFYFESRSFFAYGMFALGFVLIGIGILLGFSKMISEQE